MSKSLSTEYANLVTADIPNLWDRIDAGLSERNPSENKNDDAKKVVSIEKNRKKSFKRYIPVLSAAAIITFVMIPVAAVGLLRVVTRSFNETTKSTDAGAYTYEEDMFESVEEACAEESYNEAANGEFDIMEESAMEESVMEEGAHEDVDKDGNSLSQRVQNFSTVQKEGMGQSTKIDNDMKNAEKIVATNPETETAADEVETYKQFILDNLKKTDTYGDCRVRIIDVDELNGVQYICVEFLEDNDFAKKGEYVDFMTGVFNPDSIEPVTGEEYISSIEEYQDSEKNIYHEIILESNIRSEE